MYLRGWKLHASTLHTAFLKHDGVPIPSKMPPAPSPVALHALRTLIRPTPVARTYNICRRAPMPLRQTLFPHRARPFYTSSPLLATLNQVARTPRKPQPKRRPVSPAMTRQKRPSMKGVCLKVGITKPKKPNSGQRKTAKVRLSTGQVVSCYIPGEGHNVQQHSVVMVRGGRSQDCPGVRYHLVRGALDLVGL